MAVKVTVDGFDGLAELTRDLRRKGARKKDVTKIFKNRGKPTLVAVKSKTPLAKKTVIRRLKDGTVADTYEPGNLREAMQLFVGRKGRSKKNPTVYIGANVKSSKKIDGWYWYFVVVGTKFQAPNDFIAEAADPLKEGAQNLIVKDLVALLNKQIK